MTLGKKLYESFKCSMILGAFCFAVIGTITCTIAPQKALLAAGLAFFLMFAFGFIAMLWELNTHKE